MLDRVGVGGDAGGPEVGGEQLGLVHAGLLWVALVIVGIVWLVRRLTDEAPRSTALAEDELRRRYAIGELSRDEYLQRMADIRGG